MQGKPTGYQFDAAQIHRRLMMDPGYSNGWHAGFSVASDELRARLEAYEAALREIADYRTHTMESMLFCQSIARKALGDA